MNRWATTLGLACLGLFPAGAGAQTFGLLPGSGWNGGYIGLTGGGAASDLGHITKAGDATFAGHLGYGINLGSLYVGAEVDGTWGGAKTSSYINPLYSSTLDIDWTATARGRAGITFANALIYVTGGAAWSGRTVGVHSLGSEISSGSQTVLGTVVGAGIELKLLPGLAARIEGLRYDFSSPDLKSISQVPAALAGTTAKGGDETVVRAGISWYFN